MRLDVHPMVLAVALGLLSPSVLEAEAAESDADERSTDARLHAIAPADGAQCAGGDDDCLTDPV